jgi:O-antigen/teichoic acid export membrane protein
MTSASIHRRLSINSLANLVRYVVYVVVTFVMTPYTIRKLGLDDYGLWVLVLAVVGYGGLLELGVQTSVIKLVAQKNAANDQDGLQRVVSTAYAFFQGVGALIACALVLVAPLFVARLVSSPAEQETVRLLLIILGINAAICFPAYVLGGVIYGMQRYVVKSGVDVVLAVVNAGLTFVVLEQGKGIVGLALVKMAVDVASIAALSLLAKRILPGLNIRFRAVSASSFRELLRLGGKIFISSTTTRIATHTEPVIISAILSNAWITVFSVPKRLVDYVKEISITTSTGFMPMFSDLQGRGDTAQIARLYEQYTRYILMMVIPFVSTTMVLGGPFIRLWVGDDLAAKGGNLVVYLSVAFLIDSLQPLVWRLMIGVGRVDFLVTVSAVGSITYLALASLLVHWRGVEGIGIAAVAMAVFNQVCYLPYICRYLGISPVRHLIDCQLRPTIIWALMTFLLYAMAHVIGADSYAQLFLLPFILLFLYCIVAYYAILLPAERTFCVQKIKRVRVNL